MHLKKKVFIRVHHYSASSCGYLFKNHDGLYDFCDELFGAIAFDSLEIAQATLVNIYNGLGQFKTDMDFWFEFVEIYIPMD
jgi:hypothetical protein